MAAPPNSSNGSSPPRGPPNGNPPFGSPPAGGTGSGPILMTFNTTISDGLRLFGASSFLVIGVLSLVANILLLAVFIRGHKQFKNMAFFLIAWQMLICDFLGLLTHLVLVTPITFAGYDVVVSPFI
uniref:G-protein coupled receptors family 1 profile domain-containing protein n=1 Tax=Acrobeloides nanus TaxID=290746 RepID=A0A914DE30_9BILA